jgi:hypothetical protein
MARYALKMIHGMGMEKNAAIHQAILSILGDEALRHAE